MSGSRLSLFFVKKRAFKVFNKESKQDSYSSKILLERAFPSLKTIESENYFSERAIFPYNYNTHTTFGSVHYNNLSFPPFYDYVCIHCGLPIFNCINDVKLK